MYTGRALEQENERQVEREQTGKAQSRDLSSRDRVTILTDGNGHIKRIFKTKAKAKQEREDHENLFTFLLE